ncbi:MAG TPA: M20 family metallopeptidase [Chloroflexota bacterium]|nr:M20 family metallopeptidase [Chloroflexota bacterium]
MAVTFDPASVIDLTRDLIQLRSVNPPGDEQPVAELLAGVMESYGLEVEVQVLAENRANVIGRLRGTGTGHLVLTGHLDVVPPGEQAWRHDPFGGEEEDGRLFGRGSADMKGGVAAMVTAAGLLARDGFKPKADLIVATTAGEEAGMLGAKAMVERASLAGSAYLVVGEPTDLDVFIAEKGVLWVRVKAFGRTAHGSMPHLGANAISVLARLIPPLEEYPFTFDEHPLLGSPTFGANVIRGGNKTNVVPDYAEVELDLRTVPGQDHEDMIAKIRSMAEEAAAEVPGEIRIEVEAFNDKGPVETAAEEELVTATVAAVGDVRGQEPFVGGVPYGTDAAFLGPGFGIPMVICGPGAQGMAHQPDESVETNQLVQAVDIYRDIARRLLG